MRYGPRKAAIQTSRAQCETKGFHTHDAEKFRRVRVAPVCRGPTETTKALVRLVAVRLAFFSALRAPPETKGRAQCAKAGTALITLCRSQ